MAYLLNQVGCTQGSVILDVGCGNGRLLEGIRSRGAQGVGITISPQQVKRCKAKGLDVHLMDYKCIPADWDGRFDGIVANGSVEHFVQIPDAIRGNQDNIYRKMSSIFHRILNPQSNNKKLATTIIHFSRKIDPSSLLKNPLLQKWGSDHFHFSKVLRNFGGFYPIENQIQTCAKGFFELEHQVDGTQDYHWTAEHWLRQLKRSLLTNGAVLKGLIGKFIRHPVHAGTLLSCLLLSRSWNWQFRDGPRGRPTKLLRQTWRYT